MINNYNSLNNGMVTWFKKGFGIPEGSPSSSQSVTAKPSWLVVFLLLLAFSFGQKSMAKNTTTTIFSSQKIIINHILFSSLAEGRGGGGGHGNDDWVIRHPLDVYHVDLVSKNLNTNNLNFYEYEK